MLVFLTAWLTWPAQMAGADVAPPWAAQGASVDPGETPTHVRMVSEEVLLTIAGREQETDNPHLASDFMAGHVEATFVMRNQGAETESFDVWFPLTTSDGFGSSNQVQNFSAWVDGVPAEVGESPGRDLLDLEESVPWATWPVTFTSYPPDASPPDLGAFGGQAIIAVQVVELPAGDLETLLADTLASPGPGQVPIPDPIPDKNRVLTTFDRQERAVDGRPAVRLETMGDFGTVNHVLVVLDGMRGYVLRGQGDGCVFDAVSESLRLP